MPNEAVLLIRIIASVVFIVAAYAGYYMLNNYRKLFGVDPAMPSEGPSSRAYWTAMVFIVWAHVLVASAGFALSFH